MKHTDGWRRGGRPQYRRPRRRPERPRNGWPIPAFRAHGSSTGAALEAHYRFLLWLVPALERFPRSRKFLLGIASRARGWTCWSR